MADEPTDARAPDASDRRQLPIRRRPARATCRRVGAAGGAKPPARAGARAAGAEAACRGGRRRTCRRRRLPSVRPIRRRRPMPARVHRGAPGGGAWRRARDELLGGRLDDHRARSTPAGRRAPPARRARRGVRHLLGRDGDRLAAAPRAVRRGLLPVFHAPPPSGSRQGCGRASSEPVAIGDRHLAGRQLARARDVRHVRREHHRPSRSPPHSDAGGLAGLSAAEGLPARGPGRAADGEPARLAEAAAGEEEADIE